MKMETGGPQDRKTERVFEVAGDGVFHSFRAGREEDSGIYLKQPHKGKHGYGDIRQEYESYQRIKPHLRIPNVHLLRKGEEEVLAIQKVFGKQLGDLFLEDPEEAYVAAEKYINDLNTMWLATAKKMNKSELALDNTEILAGRIRTFFEYEPLKHFLDSEVTVNGITYKSLRPKLEAVLEKITTEEDPVMVLGHGDDHLTNIFSDKNNQSYMAIDPKMAGYYSPSISYINFAAYLLHYKYNFHLSTSENLDNPEINYALEEEYKKSLPQMITLLKKLEADMANLSDKPFLSKEYFIAATLKFVQKLNNKKNMPHIEKNNLFYLGLVIELANGKYNNISEIYENLR